MKIMITVGRWNETREYNTWDELSARIFPDVDNALGCAYDNYLDEGNSSAVLFGVVYTPSYVLRCCDENEYGERYESWVDNIASHVWNYLSDGSSASIGKMYFEVVKVGE